MSTMRSMGWAVSSATCGTPASATTTVSHPVGPDVAPGRGEEMREAEARRIDWLVLRRPAV